MIKLCQFPGMDKMGNQLIEMFYHPDMLHHSYMDKVAGARPFLPEVREYLDRLTPNPNSVYSLVNALGAFEYWSSNINGDAFEEKFLIHRGPVYGYETFVHYAKPYMHHANKGPKARAFGAVELACWNPNMHRVELVCRLDRDKAQSAGAQLVFDKIDQDMLPDVSMGCKVPFDLCSITTDWKLYKEALRHYNPQKHKHPGIAALIYHKTVKPIPGLSVTRDDYSDYLKFRMNEILPDGRKVCAFNPWPRFFDISYVFIGAEKTSKMMAKLASANGRAMVVVPSCYVAEAWGAQDPDQAHEQPATHKSFEKAASVSSVRAKLRQIREKSASQRKRAEIIKDVVPSQFMSKAVPVLEGSEKCLPRNVLDRMSEHPISEALSTPTMLGMTLKPSEFQRITLGRLGHRELADRLDNEGKVFGPVDDVDKSIPMGGEFISKLLAGLLRGSIDDRSAFGPPLQRRMIRITITKIPQLEPEREEVGSDLLDKLSAAYNGYREQAIEKIAELSKHLPYYPEEQALIYGVDLEDGFVEKTAAGIDPKLLLGAVPATYLLSAFARSKIRRDTLKGEAPGMLTELVAAHPHLAATGVAMAALKASGSDLPGKVLRGALEAGKRLAGLG